uniref:Odorant receptor n=1 Tax=Protaetia brevitarsis TaxID=348688 RepID=A0A411HR44_PROBE|nr:odorant receptor [Protaetia brevitarsis]
MEDEYVMKCGLYYLHLIGTNPFKRSIRGNIICFIQTFTAIYSLGMAIDGVISKYENIKSLAGSIDTVPSAIQTVIKLLSAIFLRQKMKNLYLMVEEKWPDDIFGREFQNKLNKWSKMFKTSYKVYLYFYVFTLVFFISRPLLRHSRILVTEWNLPCNVASNQCYGFYVVLQASYFSIIVSVVFGFDIIFYAFLFYGFCELEKIKYAFEHLSISENVEGDEEKVYVEFCKILKHHDYILRFLDMVSKVYSLQLLSNFSAYVSTIVFGVFFMNVDGFPPSKENLAKYIPYLITHHFQLIMYCVLGEMIRTQLSSVSDTIYLSKWYVKKQPKLTKAMIIVMQMSRIPNKILIGGIWAMDLDLFMKVVKTSISVHAFMQTIYQVD